LLTPPLHGILPERSIWARYLRYGTILRSSHVSLSRIPASIHISNAYCSPASEVRLNIYRKLFENTTITIRLKGRTRHSTQTYQIPNILLVSKLCYSEAESVVVAALDYRIKDSKSIPELEYLSRSLASRGLAIPRLTFEPSELDNVEALDLYRVIACVPKLEQFTFCSRNYFYLPRTNAPYVGGAKYPTDPEKLAHFVENFWGASVRAHWLIRRILQVAVRERFVVRFRVRRWADDDKEEVSKTGIL